MSKGRTYESLGSSNLFGSCCVCVDVGHKWLDEPNRERGKKRRGEGGGEQRDLVGVTRWLSFTPRAENDEQARLRAQINGSVQGTLRKEPL